MELKTDNRALRVEGIRDLDQYGSYVNQQWEKGVVYFVRNYFFREVQARLQRGVPLTEVRPLIARLNALNSEIEVWEQNGGRVG